MKNSKFVIDKLAKLFEQGLVSSKDLANEIGRAHVRTPVTA